MTDFSQRNPVAGVSELIWQRRSPRAFIKQPLGEGVLERLMDAARWSPSCINEQPWIFYTSTEATFPEFLGLLVEGNQKWARNASVLGFVVARTQFKDKEQDNPFARFDSGAAWMAMTLQARMEGLYTHGMGGINRDEVIQYLNLDTRTHDLIMGFAIGVAAAPDDLDEETRARETPNARVPLSEVWISR